MKTVLTGIQPTGDLHVGNYWASIAPVVRLSKMADRAFVFIADLHSLNDVTDSQKVNRYSYDIAATVIASGFDLSRGFLFRQSDVLAHPLLASLLMNVTPKGLMDRAHAYKGVVDANLAAGKDADADINMGLYTYPILMAADILLYRTERVPVGQDQRQHIEFARDIAGYFNRTYKRDVFVLPEADIQEAVATVPGLDGRKMSKSYGNVIPILAEPAVIEKAIMRIVTDSKRPEEPKDPNTSTIYQIAKLFLSPAEQANMAQSMQQGGVGYGDLKKQLAQIVIAHFTPIRERYQALMADRRQIDDILQKGAAEARNVSQQTLTEVTQAMLGRNPGEL